MKTLFLYIAILCSLQASDVLSQSKWRQLTAPYAGYVTSITVSRSFGILAGTADNGLLRSTDDGDHWTQLPFYGGRINTILEAPGSRIFVASESGPIWISTDGGSSWRLKSSGLEGKTITHLVSNSTGMLFAAGMDGIYRSTDNGDNWAAVINGLGNQRVMQIAISIDDHLFAATYRSGVYRSYDSGDSWLSVSSTLSSGKARSIVVDSYRIVYVGTESNGIFSSGDDGNTWDQLLGTGTFPSLGFDHSNNIVALDDHGILSRSTDSGTHWRTLSNDNLTFIVSAFWFDHDGFLYGGTKGAGIFKAVSGIDKWTRIGFSSAAVASLFSLPQGRLLAGTQNGFLHDGGVWSSLDNGNSWQGTSLAGVQLRSLEAGTHGTVVCAASDAIYSADSAGNTWTQLTYGNPPGSLTSTVQVNNGDLIAGTVSKGIFRYSKGGAQWTFSGADSSTVFGFTNLNNGSLLAATDKGLFQSSDQIHWQASGTILNSMTVTAVRNEGDVVLAGTNSAIYRSTDQGVNWQLADLGDLVSLPGSVTAFSAMHYPVVFASTTRGVFQSTDAGLHWFSFGADLDSVNVTSILFAPNNYVFAGTSGNGIYISRDIVNSVAAGNVDAREPAQLRLEPNFPNPFNPSTTIRFTISERQFVQIDVFNILGEKIAQLAGGFMQAGSHSVVWNAEGLSSGEYVVVLSAPGGRLTRKMLLLR